MNSIKRLLIIVPLLVISTHSYAQSIDWQAHYNKSVEYARQEQKYIFIYFHQNGCPPCDKMGGTFLSTIKNPAYGRSPKELMDNFVVVVYNISYNDQRNRFLLYQRALAGRRDYEQLTGTPCYIIINPNNLTKLGLENSIIIKSHTGYLNPNQFVDWVYKAVSEDYSQQ